MSSGIGATVCGGSSISTRGRPFESAETIRPNNVTKRGGELRHGKTQSHSCADEAHERRAIQVRPEQIGTLQRHEKRRSSAGRQRHLREVSARIAHLTLRPGASSRPSREPPHLHARRLTRMSPQVQKTHRAKSRRTTAWHRSRIRATYERTGSVAAAAQAVGVSLNTAYRWLSDRVSARTHKLATQREALQLYASGLSCRAVAREIKRRHGNGPSHAAVCEWAFAAGLLRDKSRADELQNARRNERHYDSLRAEARRLAEEHLWSVRRIAAHLHVSRNFVKRAIDDEYKDDPSSATLKRRWSAMLPDVDRRRAVRDEVIARRERGERLKDIVAATGKSLATVCKYLREAGLTNSKREGRAA